MTPQRLIARAFTVWVGGAMVWFLVARPWPRALSIVIAQAADLVALVIVLNRDTGQSL